MKHASIQMCDEDYNEIWYGSLYRYCKDNQFTREDVRELIADLRASLTAGDGRPEPLTVGGGAAPIFNLCLFA